MEPKKYSFQSKNFVLLIFLLLIESLFSRPIQAQVIPDSTLGNEKSSINQIDALNDRIDGGARRGGNLFHSFQEFNINQGKGVYFANPQGIMNIFSRVTGGNASQILGRLGVLGQSNLFFLNPYGIIFGPNSSLDIRGSFVSSTANAVNFADGTVFSAINPQNNALLTISVPIGLQTGNLESTLSNRGNLVVGKDFTLSAGNLDLQGQLSAGGNLTLEALNTLLITDSITNPFVAFAGGVLTAQGNNFVKINVLNHPNSGLSSGGDLILRSDFPIKADAHFWSGGSFRIEQLNGSLGSLSSTDDPVIRASGDVSLDSYSGVSLHIFAGGSVTIPGTVTITGVESVENSISQTVTLSDGTTVVIDGSVEPTLDIRAGTLAIGNPIDTGTPTSADISIGSIRVSDVVNGTGGKVFLTNQYQPNTTLESTNGITVGAIDTRDVLGGGSVIIDARSSVNLNGIINASAYLDSNMPSYLGNGGNVTLLSVGNLLSNSSILAQGLFGAEDILLDNGLEINVRSGGGGNITINAQNVSLSNASKLRAGIATGLGTPEAQAGDIIISATGTIAIADSSFISNALLENSNGNAGDIIINADREVMIANGSSISNLVQLNSIGNAGDIKITTGSLFLSDGAVVNANTSGKGNAGVVKITASDTISLSDENSRIASSGIFSTVARTGEGNSGGIEISTGSLVLTDGRRISASTLGKGNAGTIKITASETISLTGKNISGGDGSGILSSVANTGDMGKATIGEGNAGEIEISTVSLSLTDGAIVSARTEGQGNAGAILITANDTIFLAGLNSGILSGVDTTAIGNSGEIEIITGSLFLIGGAIVSAETLGTGEAGNINLNATQLNIQQARITAFTNGTGNAGNITIRVQNTLQSNNGTISTAANQSSGGSINITASDIRLQGNSDIRTQVASGAGGGGDINLTADSILAFNDSDILAFAQNGVGGNIRLNTPVFFGNGYQATAQVNQNPDTLDNNNRVDINASGAVSGVISVPDLTFIQNSLFELPETLINTENLLANSCVVPNQQKAGTFILTGPDGLPTRPNNNLTSPYPTGTIEAIPELSPPKIDEPQNFYRLKDGTMVLSRKCY